MQQVFIIFYSLLVLAFVFSAVRCEIVFAADVAFLCGVVATLNICVADVLCSNTGFV